MSGYTSYRAGLAAEDTISASYQSRGHQIAARRWRSEAGEIDLIARDGDTIVFVEVKKARNLARAAESLRPRQMHRLMRSAEAFLGLEPLGLNTPARFDVALVDGTGQFEIIENALAA